jgi:tRNA threonylcarbamoyladenosine biosynthesis protein TsaB
MPSDVPASILALDSASGACAAGVVQAGLVRFERSEDMQRGQAARLPALVAQVLAGANVQSVGLVAVTVGPGSFTGLRAGLALAHGLAAGWGCPIVGVSVPEALAHGLDAAGRDIWVALHSRLGRVFLARGGIIESRPLDDLPRLAGPTVVTGNAGHAVIAALRERGDSADLHQASAAAPAAIAAIALQRLAGQRPPLAPQPLYIDAPEARLPSST